MSMANIIVQTHSQKYITYLKPLDRDQQPFTALLLVWSCSVQNFETLEFGT